MRLADEISKAALNHDPIPEGKADEKYRFYYRNYADNLYCPPDAAALEAYSGEAGVKPNPQGKNRQIWAKSHPPPP